MRLLLFFIIFNASPLFSQMSAYDHTESKAVYAESYSESESETCFCFEFNVDPFGWQNAYNAVQNAAYDKFYRDQRNVIEQEIEKRLGKDFSNYEEAVKELFKEKVTQEFAYQYVTDKVNALVSVIEKSKPIAQAAKDKFRLFEQLQYNTGNSTMFGQLRHNGKLLTAMTSSEAYHLANNVYGAEGLVLLSDIISLVRQRESLGSIRENKQLESYLTNQMWAQHKSYSDYNEIRQISGYLIYFANRDNGVPMMANTLGLFSDIAYFDYNSLANSANNQINTLIHNNIDLSNTFNNEIKDIHNLKLAYSTEKENIGLATANFLSDYPDLKKGCAEFMSNNNHSSQSIHNVKEILENYRYDDPWIRSNYLTGYNVGFQTQDRPDRLFLMRWSTSAYEKGYSGISSVLEQLSLLENNYKDGVLIKAVYDHNFSGTLPTTIDYGKLFDFSFSSGGLRIVFSPFARSHIFGDLEHADNTYGMDLFTNPIKIEMLETISNGGCVNFNKQTIHENCLQPWYLDTDGDQYHSAVVESKLKPPGAYISYTRGLDCDDTDRSVQKLNKCGKCELESRCFDLNDPCANKDLRNKKVSDEVKNLIDNRTQTVTIPRNGAVQNVKSFKIQTIEEGYGDINLDKYSLEIVKLPNGYTAQQLFEEIRQNFADFIIGGDLPFTGVNLMSYSDEDEISWYSDNPVGAAMDFDTFLDTSTVICTEYSLNEMYWTFTTVKSVDHLGHFVSGHRKFGLVDNSNGTYSFYLRGADRLGQWIDFSINGANTGADLLFNLAGDSTWKNFMKTLENYMSKKPGAKVLSFDKNRNDYGKRYPYNLNDCKD